MSESRVLAEAILTASELGSRMFRNNVGIAFQPNGQVIKYGLCVGSSDLIGWTPMVITQDMVGLPIAVFTAIECKHGKKKPTKEQANFIEQIKLAGGIAFVARSANDVFTELNKTKGNKND